MFNFGVILYSKHFESYEYTTFYKLTVHLFLHDQKSPLAFQSTNLLNIDFLHDGAVSSLDSVKGD